MPKLYRVVAHGMHETELNAAESLLTTPRRTEAFVTGIADEDQIKNLKATGLIVDTVSEVDAHGTPKGKRPETPGLGAALTPGAKLRSTTFFDRPLRVEDTPDLTVPQFYLIEIKGPLLSEYKQQLNNLKVRLLEAFANDYYSAYLTPSQYKEVRQLDFVADVTLYDSSQTAPGAAATFSPLADAPVRQSDVNRMLTYDIRLHREEDAQIVLDWLRDKGVSVAGQSGRKIRIYLLEDSPLLGELAALPAVQGFEEFVPARLFNDSARELLAIDNPGTATLPFEGEGQIVAVADSGLDDSHPDFQGRTAGVVARGRPGNWTDPSGHGTHVAGSAVGDGSASSGVFKGTAPAAKLYFQSLLDSRGELGGLPLDLNDLFAEAYLQGARVHNNSWGTATASTYRFDSREVDEFVARHRDMLIVIAAGNEGQAATTINSQPGFVDWLSIGAPATAKNALTVGACRNDRTNGAYSAYTWRQAWSNDFPNPPIANELVSGDPESLAGFSSRGPSDDRRIKPDVVAPGTDILSCKSKNAPIKNFWGAYQQNAHYAYDGGTSMATPLVSGCSALVREYYSKVRKHQASSALVRATLINGARWLQGSDANGSNQPATVPPANFDQGFGRVDMAGTLPHKGSSLALEFIDNWQDKAGQFQQTGDRRRYRIKVRAGRALRICLAYTDIPARALQNNLDLFVQPPRGPKYIGNQQLRLSLGLPDGDNNVEVVRIPNPDPGEYLIQISASNLLQTPQDFALVVTGDLDGSLAKA